MYITVAGYPLTVLIALLATAAYLAIRGIVPWSISVTVISILVAVAAISLGFAKEALQSLSYSPKSARMSVSVLIAVSLVAGAAFVILPPRRPTQGASADLHAQTSPSVAVTTAWPWVTGCPSTSSKIAMPTGGGTLQEFHAPVDLTSTLTGGGAGSWTYGQLYLDFSAVKGTSVEIVGLTPHIQRKDLAAPVWIYVPNSGCGPLAGDRVFRYDLDKPGLPPVWLTLGVGGSQAASAAV